MRQLLKIRADAQLDNKSVRQLLKIRSAAQFEAKSVRQLLKIRADAQLDNKTVRQLLNIRADAQFNNQTVRQLQKFWFAAHPALPTHPAPHLTLRPDNKKTTPESQKQDSKIVLYFTKN